MNRKILLAAAFGLVLAGPAVAQREICGLRRSSFRRRLLGNAPSVSGGAFPHPGVADVPRA
jgi:hypothetical protein